MDSVFINCFIDSDIRSEEEEFYDLPAAEGLSNYPLK